MQDDGFRFDSDKSQHTRKVCVGVRCCYVLMFSWLSYTAVSTARSTWLWQIYVRAEVLWNMSKNADANNTNHTLFASSIKT